MCFKTIHLFFAFALLLLLAGCGGGGSTTAAGLSGPYIDIAVAATDSGMGGSLQYSAWGYVNESSMTSPPITDAVVTINGVPLTYNVSTKSYMASSQPATFPDANGKLNLTVIAKGKTYVATQDAPDTLPVLLVPNPVVAANATTISWTQNVSTRGLVPTHYSFLAYISTPTGSISTYRATTTDTSVNIPANTFSGGTTYWFNINSQYNEQPIANTAQLSGFTVLAAPISTSRTAQ